MIRLALTLGTLTSALTACGVDFTAFGEPGGGGTGGTATTTTQGGSGGTGGEPSMGGSGGTRPLSCRALAFDGIDDYVEVADHSQLDGLSTLTVEAWVELALHDSEVHILSHHDHDANTGYVLLIFGSDTSSPDQELQFRYQFGGENHPTGFDAVPTGAWHHIAATYDGTALRTYIDGDRVENNTIGAGTAADFAGPLRIGAAAYTNNFHFKGKIDEVRLSGVARYTASSFDLPPRRLDADADTIALWKFDEADGDQTARDSASQHDGVLGNSATIDPSDPVRVDVPCDL